MTPPPRGNPDPRDVRSQNLSHPQVEPPARPWRRRAQPALGAEFSSEVVRVAVGLTTMQLTVRWPAVQEASSGSRMRTVMAPVVIALSTLPMRALQPLRARRATTAAPGWRRSDPGSLNLE